MVILDPVGVLVLGMGDVVQGVVWLVVALEVVPVVALVVVRLDVRHLDLELRALNRAVKVHVRRGHVVLVVVMVVRLLVDDAALAQLDQRHHQTQPRLREGKFQDTSFS